MFYLGFSHSPVLKWGTDLQLSFTLLAPAGTFCSIMCCNCSRLEWQSLMTCYEMYIKAIAVLGIQTI